MNSAAGIGLREMADEANLGANLEMFFALKVAVASGTKYRPSA